MIETADVPVRGRVILDLSDTLHEALRIAAEVAQVPLAQHIGTVLRRSEQIDGEPTSGLRRRGGAGPARARNRRRANEPRSVS